ncbi:YbbC/YhhH family protein [Parabacteroides sp. FAFU027]|uniref:YbbC/YhhH family protein n=1 Tax=Parabacteroides sp. FAFU027 TaxID=2922715 RepID=UPI001FAF1FEB|nr:YbbC/YhhH family protein [Parabacteroides sp. FAFU027]
MLHKDSLFRNLTQNYKSIMWICIILLIILFFTDNFFFTDKQKVKNDAYLIRNESTAVKIAEAILFEHYGKMKINLEKPFSISLKSDSLWYIEGTSYTTGFASGGVFHITLSARNGRVVDMYHDK